MDHLHPRDHAELPDVQALDGWLTMELKRLANQVQTLMAAGQSPLDQHLLQALTELGEHASAIARLASRHAGLIAILVELDGFSQFDATGTKCDEALRLVKRRARRAAQGALPALWDRQAERDLLEDLLHAVDAQALDRALLDLADRSGYLSLIDVDWAYWHYGRHAEQAQVLEFDEAVRRLFAAAWQIQHDILAQTDPQRAELARARIRGLFA